MIDFETFLTALYVFVEDFCKGRWAPERSRGAPAGLTRSEVVTLAIAGQFRLGRERPHELGGFAARVTAKMALHNFCVWLNRRLGRPSLAFAELIGW